ncbi:MAG: proton-conducting transporter membrane subunit, partial [Pirellulaceae bacterium]|nr:proton-conducting transporter membrane subunit [Pirellulaceae bacterium]
MSEFRVPWLLLAIGIPAVAAVLLSQVKDGQRAKQGCLWALGLSLAATIAEWIEFSQLHANQAHDRWDVVAWLIGFEVLVVDRFSAPLLGLHALYSFLLVLATMRTKISRVSFGQLLAAHVVHQLMFSVNHPVILLVLAAVNLSFPWYELRMRGKGTRVFLVHAVVLLVCLSLGYGMARIGESNVILASVGHGLLVLGLMARCWTIPFHCGLVDLYDRMGFGSAILFSAVMVGPYLAIRLGLPVLPDWSMQVLAFFGLLTAAYSASMALVQTDVRRVFCYLFLGHGSLILVGLETGTAAGVAAALGLWLGSSIAVVGLGLTLRSLEARFGRLSLAEFKGYYEHVPQLASLCVVTGLALVGFPGTVGFVA